MLIPTSLSNNPNITGFTGHGLGKNKPHPYILRLKPYDISKYHIKNVDFTCAHFDIGDSANFEENWIVTSTGSFIIKWNFRKLKKIWYH